MAARRNRLVFMDQSLTVGWVCLLGAGLILDDVLLRAINSMPLISSSVLIPTSYADIRPPRLIDCVFFNRANATCRWETAVSGDTPATSYTLVVERRPTHAKMKNSLDVSQCNTPNTSCTANTSSSVRFTFCITVTAHGDGWNISSQQRCQSGRLEVMLPPVSLNSIKPVRQRPQCLNVTWSRVLAEFPVSDLDIRNGDLTSQVEFMVQGQLDVQVRDEAVTDYSFLVCLLRPDTSYTIRLRHRYRGPESPWSLWSNACQGRTGEDAPSAAPAFWRQVKQGDKDGWRLVSLLWKPLPHFLANGIVLFFNMTCQTENAEVPKDHGSCRELLNSSTSCSLRLPAGRCLCSLTASTSAGTSPKAQIWLRGAADREPPPPRQITAIPLNDSSLHVRWKAPVDHSVSGFVVEWFAAREKSSIIQHWQKMNNSCTALVITEGVMPLEHYVVSVTVLYGEQGASQKETVRVYTRQGVPSAGPVVDVLQISGSSVDLRWKPIPVEQMHGFIQGYTVSYSLANQSVRRVFVPAHTYRYSLKNLLPGKYAIFMQISTEAGAGAAGPTRTVMISEDAVDISVLISALLPLMLSSLVLLPMACLAHRVKKMLFGNVPDPSDSSLAQWTPKVTLESTMWPAVAENTEIKYSDVLLLDERELLNSSADRDPVFQSVENLQTSQCFHPLSVSEAQTPQARSEKRISNSSSARTKIPSNSDPSFCPSIYSSILLSHSPKRLLSPLLSPSHLQSTDWEQSTVSVSDIKLQLGGDSEPCLQGRSATRFDSASSQTLGPIPSSSDFDRVTSAHPPSSHGLYNSVPVLQPNTLTRHDAFTKLLSPGPCSLLVDFSYRPLSCDPHISMTD